MARTIGGPNGSLSGGNADKILLANAGDSGDGVLIMQELFTTTGSFTVTAAMDEVTFIGVGGGGAGATGFGGGGAGFFQKTFRVGSDVPAGTLFNLTIGAATGTTFLRDAGNTVLCQATGGKNATASAHGTGGTASGGDINSNGAPGTPISANAAYGGAYGGAAGSPYGHSTGPDMYLISEYARGYVRQVKAAWLKSGADIPKETGTVFNGGIFGAATTAGETGGFGGAGAGGAGNSGSSGSARSGGNGGFGGRGGGGGYAQFISGLASNASLYGGSGGKGGFGAAGGDGGAVGLIGRTAYEGPGGGGGFGGGGGPGGGAIGAGQNVSGGKGGSGGYGGGGGGGYKRQSGDTASPGIGGTGGAGAILVLITARDDLAAVHM